MSKILHSLLIMSFLFFAQGFTEEPTDYTLTNVQIKDAKWTTPSDGTSPKLQSYKIEFKINNNLLFSLMDSSKEPFIFPLEFLKDSDQITILHEGYILNANNRSWFRVLWNGIEFDAQGPSIKPKMNAPKDDSLIEKIQDVQISKSNQDPKKPYEISFRAKGYYFTVPVESDKYHGFYTDKPFYYLGASEKLKSQSNHFYNILLKDLETQEDFQFESWPYNSNKDVVVTKLEATNIKYSAFSFNAKYVEYAETFTFLDGGVYSHNFPEHLERINFDPQQAVEKLASSIGKEFIILEETPDGNNKRQSKFVIQSKANGKTFTVVGPPRTAKL